MNYVKYPRTPHLPWSLGCTSDDIVCIDLNHFKGKQVVVTEKMDGENTSLYRDYIHARSIDGHHHPSRDWVKRFHASIAHEIPQGWRICGENLYAQHSIRYEDLPSYFMAFSMWDENNQCLDWQTTVEYFGMLEMISPTLLYKGLWDESLLRDLSINTAVSEGFVVRLAESFHYSDFACSVAKWVRASHVNTDKHWMYVEVIPNGLQGGLQNAGS